MKHLSLIALVAFSVFASGCTSFPLGAAKSADDTQKTSTVAVHIPKDVRKSEASAGEVMVQDQAGSVVVQKVEFRPGVSSASVERLAKEFGCNGRSGAGLLTEKGPVEVYRMQCDNGKAFLAKCELRQCKPMR